MSKQGGEKTFTWDDPLILLGIFMTIYFACLAIWYFAHTEISMVYIYIRYVQLWLINALGSVVDLPGITPVRDWVQEMCQPDGLISLCHRDFSTVKWKDISNSSIAMNLFFLILMVVMCVRMFLVANATHPKIRFTKTHNIKSFVKENKPLYPHLRLFSEIDLISQPLDHPVFGMSLTSRQFAYRHRLISGWKEETDGSWTPTLDREKTSQVFRVQLGRHWTKPTDLSTSETLLVAIAMPRVAATDPSLDEAKFKDAMKDSENLLKWCWDQFKPPAPAKKKKGEAEDNPLAWLRPKIDLEYPRSIIDKYIDHPAVRALIERHAYNRTIIFALFMQARRLGVLQPAEMRWMRFFDRELWYVLETIGRQAGFAEAAAVLSHYLYESKSGTALVEPQLDKAINGLEVAMTAFKFTTADKERYEKGGGVSRPSS
jgi:intracellular multiplication protein IcmP